MDLRKLIEVKSGYHVDWVTARINFILKFFNYDMAGKTVLELGSHISDIGGNLANFGAIVTSVEGRPENITRARGFYPNVKYIHHDCDKSEWIFEEYDIIIHFGLLYHMSNPDYLLIESQRHCKYFFLECHVVDSDYKEICIIVNKSPGLDQGLNNESQLSVRYIENRLSNYKRYDLQELNGGIHYYDWVSSNNEKINFGNRRLWVCEFV